jgi:hypothetical protein
MFKKARGSDRVQISWRTKRQRGILCLVLPTAAAGSELTNALARSLADISRHRRNEGSRKDKIEPASARGQAPTPTPNERTSMKIPCLWLNGSRRSLSPLG